MWTQLSVDICNGPGQADEFTSNLPTLEEGSGVAEKLTWQTVM